MNETGEIDGHFLAYVEFIKPETSNRYARLRPIYHIINGSWERIEQGDHRFQDEGLVFWWSPNSHAVEHTVWVVTLVRHPKYGTETRYKDRYQVSYAFQPFQAISLYNVNGAREFRRALSSGHLSFDGPILGQPLLRVVDEEDEWITIPEISKSAEVNDHWDVTIHSLEGVVPVYTIESGSFERVEVNGDHISLILDHGISTGYQCALSDIQLIEHLRKRISRIDRDVLNSLDVTKNILREYVELIGNAGLGGDEALKENAYGDAAMALVEGIDSEIVDIDDFVDTLMKYPRIAEDVKARSDIELQRRREEFERQLAKEDHIAIEKLQKTKDEVEIAKSELGELRRSITEAVDDILEAPVQALVKHDLLDGLRRHLKTSVTRSLQMKKGGGSDNETTDIDSLERLKEITNEWSAYGGLDPYVMQTALASVLAHRVTLISGANAEVFSIALTSILAGDHAVRVSVSTAIFGISDLLNSPATPIGNTSFTHGCTLGEFLMQLNDGEPAVILLSGCNRAPLEVVLPDFMQPTINSHVQLSWRDEENQIVSSALFPYVRFIGTMHNGDATYLVPTELSRQLGYIPSERHEMDALLIGQQVQPSIARIRNSLWDSIGAPSAASDIDRVADWLRRRGAELPVADLTKVLHTYVNLMGDDVRGTGEAISSLMLGRGLSLDCKEMPGANGEKLCELLNSQQEAPIFQESASYFKMVDKK